MTDPNACSDPKDRGVAAIWLVLMLSLIMGFAAMSVDLGQWYLTRTKVQNASDAAALAGAALLPDDPAEAIAEAKRVAGQHGYNAATVTATLVGESQLQVKIQTSVENVFLPALGFENQTSIGGSATAEYEGTVAMGSPNAILGNDPETGTVGDDLVLALEGPDYNKRNGDRFQTKTCSGSVAVAGCDASGVNLEYDEDGYFFSVNVSSLTGEDLVIEAFDPAWVYTGGNCTVQQTSGGSSTGGHPTATELTDLFDLTDGAAYVQGADSVPAGYYDDAANRYDTGKDDFCIGDSSLGVLGHSEGAGTDMRRMQTSYIVRAPDSTPWNNLDNPIIDQVQCRPTPFSSYFMYAPGNYNYYSWDLTYGNYFFDWDGSINQMLDPGEGGDQWIVDLTDDDWTFAEIYRRWVPVCRIPAVDVEVGEYLLQIRTNANAADPTTYDPGQQSWGINSFSLRAGFATAGGTDPLGSVTLAGAGRLPLWAQVDNSSPEFFLARVLPTSRDRTLTIELFDAGDADGLATGTIQVLPPVDSNYAAFSGCEFQRDDGGSMTTNAATCSWTDIDNVSYQGRTVIVSVPIPDDYTCDDLDPTGCWVKLSMVFPSEPSDFTTWSAYISGDPVRLIE